MPTISYAITASTEAKELRTLLDALESLIRKEDEIIIQLDQDNTADDVESLLKEHFSRLTAISFPLNNHFSNFKNNLKNHCSKDYIFQIDADEIPHTELINLLPDLLAEYSNIGLFHVPRINTVEGITDSHLKQWRWTQNDKGWLQWPDWQPRIFKNSPDIRWRLPVHETIINYKTAIFFPDEEEYSLYHPKTIKKQESQNELYSTI